MAFVCDQFGECSSRNSGGNTSTQLVILHGSVGRGGRNLREDVSAIQNALNQMDLANGGPVAPLVVDGLVGPKTMGAIERFQSVQFPAKFADGRVDPGQRTVQRLNELLATRSVVSAAASPAAFVPQGSNSATQDNRFGFEQASFTQSGTTDDQIRLAERLAEDAERRLTTALNRMNQAIVALGKKTHTAREQALVREINWHFKASADTNPTSHMAKVQTVLATMLTAVREQNLGSRSLFRKGTHPDPNAIAAAELGGFFSVKQDERFIIITPNFRTQSSGVIVHELGHFCGGNKSSGKDVVHRASPLPFPTGTRKEDGSTNYRDMPPFHARTNVYSYQIYCFPELPEFKVPA
jgi:peptidoglycan hydrolase-like protein with peptidoglycan-binding domain